MPATVRVGSALSWAKLTNASTDLIKDTPSPALFVSSFLFLCETWTRLYSYWHANQHYSSPVYLWDFFQPSWNDAWSHLILKVVFQSLFIDYWFFYTVLHAGVTHEYLSRLDTGCCWWPGWRLVIIWLSLRHSKLLKLHRICWVLILSLSLSLVQWGTAAHWKTALRNSYFNVRVYWGCNGAINLNRMQ